MTMTSVAVNAFRHMVQEQVDRSTSYPEVKTILKAKQLSKWRHEHPRYNKADPYYLFTRREQVTVFRLRTGRDRLNYHLYSKLHIGQTEQLLMLLVGCLTSQQHASVSQGRICSDNFTCCHTEIEVADQTFYLTQSQYTDTGPSSPSADPITPGAWQATQKGNMARPDSW